ncbi:acyl-CoA dehydrogenase [Streptomyces clavuligerus]|uniref:Acyl-CoA dehydrogenase n=1 Tax=Streptomyces clavuligerus TaxID=1901 RepID=E2Q087_STRCL|nr:acyl-CoA dehydrogenase [Streptomyces clavuligerus]ANW18809.1 acyl-CoA dehydrogenase [Streptomyces clavuligerus]AXU13378.1 acyl-CoA dehydrogenase [Streptomyces clavuligerus]EFG08506.1 acyl-CoA dehydrogenase [Streptomyces clavuligerus]MBY6303335.1 acyl-CoA dehydrogenase family protein [Streptomyces clavuligerus]QCS06161.1 acyl-CoA dehydrogenase [Streptomyces clavuligerus]
MDFRLGAEQRALCADTRRLLARLWPGDAPGRAAALPAPVLDREVWRALGEAGFFALRLPEEAGGAGLGLLEAVLVFTEAGRVLLPGPLVGTHLAAGALPGAARGEQAVAWLDGELVAWLDAADGVWCRGAPAPAAAVRAGAVPLRSVDPLTPLHRVPTRTPGPYDAVGALLTAAEQLGSAERTLALAVRHAREREQFGRPIGAFQAVKHLCADALVRTELARGALHAAAVLAGPATAAASGSAGLAGPAGADPVAVAGAKLLADDAAVRNARDCLQVYGGMGFTWEAEVHLHLKRAWVRARARPTAAQAEEVCAEALDTG